MTMPKRAIWCGNRFLDTYHIKTTSGEYMNRRQHGGIKNCEIDGLDNHHVGCKYAAANFLLSKRIQESCVDFGESVNLDNNYLDCYTAPCEWLHIAYIDALPNLDLSKLSKKIFKNISCDFCYPEKEIVKKQALVKNLKYCDIVFGHSGKGNIRYSETYDIRPEVFVLHHPGGSTLYYGNRHLNTDVLQKPYIFTVGAGDRFAAAFIEYKLGGERLEDCPIYAHQQVGKWLEEVNRDL